MVEHLGVVRMNAPNEPDARRAMVRWTDAADREFATPASRLCTASFFLWGRLVGVRMGLGHPPTR
jgi:hypothetical protein